MEINKFTVGPFAENTYLIDNAGKALLVDPGFHTKAEFNGFQQTLDERSISLEAIVLTHAHVDHVLGLHRARQHYKVPVYLSSEDRYLWNNIHEQASAFGFDVKPFEFAPQDLPAQEKWHLHGFTFSTFYTPGHAPDHVVLYSAAHQLLIGGDTLFREGIGRTDLYKGNMQQLKQSIKQKLYKLPEATEVYPGHGPTTTIGHEKDNNPFVQG